MSSGVADRANREGMSSLRAMAHPLRMRMLSLLTGAAMSAAEVARELDITHANASYHLRQLHAARLLVITEEESVRGGTAKRYRYDIDPPGDRATEAGSARRQVGAMGAACDSELWVRESDWTAGVTAVADAVMQLHRVALPPRTEDALHVSVTTALFEMEPIR